MANNGEQDTPSCHIPDCMLPVDVVVKTSDAKFFGTHLQNLESYAEGFPPESLAKDKTINHMNIDEDSEVASLMLHLMHRQPQPDLQNIPIRVLVELAEAVEKYLIYSSIGTCRFIMSIRASEAPLLVLAYALKHGYQDVADCAAPHSLGTPLKAVKKELGPTGTALWAEYREPFLVLYQHRGLVDVSFHEDEPPECDELKLLHPTLHDLLRSPEKIFEKRWRDETVQGGGHIADCDTCVDGLKAWLQDVRDAAEGLPKFSTLLLS